MERYFEENSDSIENVEKIESSRVILRTREDIDKFVEAPLVDACKIFYDKNIETLLSSANKGDVGHGAYIEIDFRSLSEENKEIGKKQGETYITHGIANKSEKEILRIVFPIDKDTLVEDIRNRSVEAANEFQKQPANWIPRYAIEEMKEIFAYEPEEEVSPEDFIEDGYYYDKEEKLFYLSEEHYLKAKEKIEQTNL